MQKQLPDLALALSRPPPSLRSTSSSSACRRSKSDQIESNHRASIAGHYRIAAACATLPSKCIIWFAVGSTRATNCDIRGYLMRAARWQSTHGRVKVDRYNCRKKANVGRERRAHQRATIKRIGERIYFIAQRVISLVILLARAHLFHPLPLSLLPFQGPFPAGLWQPGVGLPSSIST